MLSQDGTLLCHCDQKKLRWYLNKGIAEEVSTEPPTIRLLFQHANADQTTGMDAFYSQSKRNRCVVCGEERHYLRYRILPACYRRFLPTHLKSHRSHDVVLLCVDCHSVAHGASEKLKRQISTDYGIPLRQPPPAARLSSPACQLASGNPSAALPDLATTDSTIGFESRGTSCAEESSAVSCAMSQQSGVSKELAGLTTAARRAATALHSHGATMPESRRR